MPLERAGAGAGAGAQFGGKIVGHTIGNDMSSRDIEGENLLYLPRPKPTSSCALGPWILWARRSPRREHGRSPGHPSATGNRFHRRNLRRAIKRGFEELAEFLFRSQNSRSAPILLTGTGIVPPDTFTLQEGDVMEIEIAGIGLLRNTVKVVDRKSNGGVAGSPLVQCYP